MASNVKNAARDVRAYCKALPRNAFRTLKMNRSGNRNTQWADVERQFKDDCDMAQRIILTPSPQNSMLQQMDPMYTEGVFERVMENIGEPETCLAMKSFTPRCKRGPSSRKGRKSRRRLSRR